MTVQRLCDITGREGTLLSNDCVRVIVEDAGGMVPEFSFRRGKGYTNAHWIPHFRGNTELYNDIKHQKMWGSRMMYDLCGNFLCIPNFGPESKSTGKIIPPNGFTANGDWLPLKSGTSGDYVYQISALSDCNDFSFLKTDILIKNHYVHYSIIDIAYTGNKPQPANIAWHNTVGTPFLQSGCILDASARGFITAPVNAIPGQRERLAPSISFDYLDAVPFKDGSFGSLREVPGMNGYSDFISGAVPNGAVIGWSSVFNPAMEALYLPFFQGPAGIVNDEIPLFFNNLWLQYGGRQFWPWSKYPAGVDNTFAVGTESSISALAHGLDLSLEMEQIGGNPSYITLQPNSRKKLYYATLLSPLEDSSDWTGIKSVEIDSEDSIIIHEMKGKVYRRLSIDSRFSKLKEIGKEINQ